MRIVSIFFVLACAVLTANVTASAQRNVTPAIDRDPLLEQDAKHNLEVFSKMDEFLYLAGMSSFYLSENKGRQKIDLNAEKEKEKYAPAKLREDAVAYLSILVEKYPESRYRGEAQEALARIKPKE
ncbi:MAG: hypothetical protein LC730_03825 [Acidobacteria bacterium]|nr:hypothetical protein [Acidobacteriota bacterium]